jgi:hypothetical protein
MVWYVVKYMDNFSCGIVKTSWSRDYASRVFTSESLTKLKK